MAKKTQEYGVETNPLGLSTDEFPDEPNEFPDENKPSAFEDSTDATRSPVTRSRRHGESHARQRVL